MKYRYIQGYITAVMAELNDVAKDGWSFESITPLPSYSDDDSERYIIIVSKQVAKVQ